LVIDDLHELRSPVKVLGRLHAAGKSIPVELDASGSPSAPAR
jgi:hypothetical protein